MTTEENRSEFVRLLNELVEAEFAVSDAEVELRERIAQRDQMLKQAKDAAALAGLRWDRFAMPMDDGGEASTADA